MLILVGIGIGRTYDGITVCGLSAIKKCSNVHLLSSKYHPFNQEQLEKYLDCKCILIDPCTLEEFLGNAANSSEGETALLMPGNPFCDNLFPKISYLCRQLNLPYKVIHNTSYMNAIGNTGIQMYKIGETVFLDSLSSDETSECLKTVNSNLERNLNTLVIFNKCSEEQLSSGLLKSISGTVVEGTGSKSLNPETKIVSLFRAEVGDNFGFDFGTAKSLLSSTPSHKIEALCICSEFDCVEEEYLQKMRSHQQSEAKGSEVKGQFIVVGLGLGSPQDITLKGRALVERSQKVFLEGYTSIMIGGKESLEQFYLKEIVVADREMVEQDSDVILSHMDKGNVSFLVVGDPLGATTHTDIILRSLDKASNVVIANNSSIINAIGLSGLKPKNFGGIVSIPFWTDSYKPDSFYDKISANLEKGWHTLCLLDIQVKEQSFENLARGRKIYEKPRYMSSTTASKQLLESKEKRVQDGQDIKVNENTLAITLARIGTDEEEISVFSLGELLNRDLGPPLHSLVIVGSLDQDEERNIKRKS